MTDRHIAPAISTRGVATRAAAKLAAEVVGRLLQFSLIYVAQRTLGPVDYGHLTYALALGFVLAPTTDLGLQLTLTRRLARGEGHPNDLIGAAFAIKSILVIPAMAGVLVIGLTRPWEVRSATIMLGMSVIIATYVDFTGYVFRGLGLVTRDAVLTVVSRATTVWFGLGMLAGGGRLDGLSVAYLCGASVGPAVGGIWLQLRLGLLRLSKTVDWRRLMTEAFPLGAGIAISMLYVRTAVFLLDSMRGPDAVGIFSVAQRLTEPLAIIPAAVMAAVFPVVARRSGDVIARQIGTVSLVLLACLGCFVAAAGYTGGPWLIGLLYDSVYAGSAAPLQILALAVAPTFVNYGLTHVLIANRFEYRYLACVTIAFATNLILCMLLIPSHGPSGAAWAVLGSECLLFGSAVVSSLMRQGRAGIGSPPAAALD